MLSLLLTLGAAFACLGIGFKLGWDHHAATVPKPKPKPKRPAEMPRRGIYKTTVNYKWCSNTSAPKRKQIWEPRVCNATVIVEEVGRVASQSKVRIIHYDDLQEDSKKWLMNNIYEGIGEYIETDKIEWHEDPEPDPEEEEETLTADEMTKLKKRLQLDSVIMTPLSELVKQIDMEDITDV